MLNKKGAEEEIISIWMFIVWAVIFVGISASLYMFYSNQTDVRSNEANILYSRIIGCISQQGKLVPGFDNNFDFFSECGLSKKIIESEEKYYFSVDVYKTNDEVLYSVDEGARGLDVLCKSGARGRNVPRCLQKTVYLLDDYKIKILTASNNV